MRRKTQFTDILAILGHTDSNLVTFAPRSIRERFEAKQRRLKIPMIKYRITWFSNVSRPAVEVYAFTFEGAIRKARRLACVRFLRAAAIIVR